MDIDKLILTCTPKIIAARFGSLMDIDKLILNNTDTSCRPSFGSLMDIDKLIPVKVIYTYKCVLVH